MFYLNTAKNFYCFDLILSSILAVFKKCGPIWRATRMDVIYINIIGVFRQHCAQTLHWLMIKGSQSTQIAVEKKEADPVLLKRRRTLQNTLWPRTLRQTSEENTQDGPRAWSAAVSEFLFLENAGCSAHRMQKMRRHHDSQCCGAKWLRWNTHTNTSKYNRKWTLGSQKDYPVNNR